MVSNPKMNTAHKKSSTIEIDKKSSTFPKQKDPFEFDVMVVFFRGKTSLGMIYKILVLKTQ